MITFDTVPEAFQPNERNTKILFTEVTNIHWRKKRETDPGEEQEFCKHLGEICPLTPQSVPEVICILKCIYKSFPTIQPFLSVIPYVGQVLCQGTNTVFSALPTIVAKSPGSFQRVDSFLNFFQVSGNDVADFAKSGATALPVALIRNIEGRDFNEFKLLLQNFELHDSNDKQGETGGGLMAVANVGNGLFLNGNCQKSNLDGDAITLAHILNKRPCLSDILMPGYYVFSRAPRFAYTKRILPTLMAWNMPLFLFTGVTCCLLPFADEKKTYECASPIVLFEKPHGLGGRAGFIPTRKVCGAIPDFIEQLVSLSQRSGVDEETTMPPCSSGTSENCIVDATVGSADYSAEATTFSPGQTPGEDYPEDT